MRIIDLNNLKEFIVKGVYGGCKGNMKLIEIEKYVKKKNSVISFTITFMIQLVFFLHGNVCFGQEKNYGRGSDVLWDHGNPAQRGLYQQRLGKGDGQIFC